MTNCEIILVPAFSDNYVYLVVADNACTVVDPGESGPVRKALAVRELTVSDILLTHHHSDHIGGCRELAEEYGCAVTGPEDSRIPGDARTVGEGDCVTVTGVAFDVYEVPGHTSTDIAYYSAEEGCLLTGDSLFACGCGRLFEGTPADMFQSLQKLVEFPDDTEIYCGHEYTLNNAEFAVTVDPDNQDLAERLGTIRQLRANGEPTIPSTIGEEKSTNPFLRCSDPALQEAIGMSGADPVDVFAEVRARKDAW
jgi:hydroxyacylglutathione hydrolase